MLSDEEKKAIDYLQLCYDLSTITNESLSKLGIVLNLIEKQSKEIEELNKALMTATLKIEGLKIEAVYNDNYISKDKIKAKIEELENEHTGCTTNIFSVLQSLLEKE